MTHHSPYDSLDERSARRKDPDLTTHNTHHRQTSISPAGFETAIPIMRATEDPHFRPLGHWDRQSLPRAQSQNITAWVWKWQANTEYKLSFQFDTRQYKDQTIPARRLSSSLPEHGMSRQRFSHPEHFVITPDEWLRPQTSI